MNFKFFNRAIPLNEVIKILITSDLFLQSGWGLIGPIFAIFLTGQIQGGDLKLVGFVAATYWIIKSIAQPFIAKYLDKNHGELDDFYFLVFGMYVANLVPLGYLFSSLPWHIYLLEAFRGLAMACVVPTWYAIFTRHIDKGREAFSWSIYSTSLGFAAGISGAFGGVLATILGFKFIFIFATVFGLISSSLLWGVKNKIFPKDHFIPHLPTSEKPF